MAKIDVPLADKIQKVSMGFQNLYKKLDNPNVKLNPDDLLQITNPNVNWEFVPRFVVTERSLPSSLMI